MSPRIRRLQQDHDKLAGRFKDWPPVVLTGRSGMPPERYQITYRVNGLTVAPNGELIERDQHIAEIALPLEYPRRAPQCTILTPVFHPNFNDATICIGDFWAASEGLDDLVIRIGRLITYQEYNVKSPLNGLAAQWASEHAHLLPIDSREIAPPSPSLETLPTINVLITEPRVTNQHAEPLKPETQPRVTEPYATADGRWENKIVISVSDDQDPKGQHRPREPVPRSLVIPHGVDLVRVIARCRFCEQVMQLEERIFAGGFRCPQCGAAHKAQLRN